MECKVNFFAQFQSYLLSLVLCAVLFAAPITSSAGIAPMRAISLGEMETITIGLPDSKQYKSMYGSDPNNASHCITLDSSRTNLCARYVFGNDFQLLDWLENGRIDGAVVAPLSLKILHTSDRRSFQDHFVVARKDAFAKQELDSYHIALSEYINGAQQSQPQKHYYDHLKSMMNDVHEPVANVTLESHLSPSLGIFVLQSEEWLQEQSISVEQKEELWRRLIARTVFRLSRSVSPEASTFTLRATSDCNSTTIHCLTKTRIHDYLILHSKAVQEVPPTLLQEEFLVFPNNDSASIHNTYQTIVPEYLPYPPQNRSLPAPLKEFIEANYTSHQVGSQVRRYFRFTIPELMQILHNSTDSDDNNDIALVLTGGGVKSAYQTRLVDHLYNESYLSNGNPARQASGTVKPVDVKYVIGTSGGALLGMFVASISKNESGDLNFSDLLWNKNSNTGEKITFTDVFPMLDMLRWLSFLFSFFIFSVIAIILYRFKWMRALLGHNESDTTTHQSSDAGGRFFRFSVVWIAFLALAPLLIRYVNGEQLEEHIPEIQGFFYFIFTLIAIYTDNHIIRAKRPAMNHENVDALAWLMLFGGVVMSVLPIMHRAWGIFSHIPNIDTSWVWLDNMLRWKMTSNAFLFCVGLFLLTCFIQRWYFKHSREFRPLQPCEGDVRDSYLVLLLVPIMSAAGIYIMFKFDIISAFELTISFWVGLTLMASITSLLIFGYTLFESKSRWQREWLEQRLRFLMSRHPTTWQLQMNRHTRILIMFGIAWAWWNLVVAPGMYGNNVPQDYINGLYDKVAAKQHGNICTPDTVGNYALNLQTYFVAPATSLENNNERYFLFNPHTDSSRSDSLIDYTHQLAISSDQRWTQFDLEEQDKDALTQISFASGSPFPVFPAHKIKIGDQVEKLIDGGYAHNTPIEAAKTIGAERLLVIYSSPLSLGSGDGSRFLQDIFGTMAKNLPRLVPYLYQRSQIEDILSAEELLVAALSPTGGKKNKWPLLTDFRQSVVKRMINEADQDIDKRIGTIQNWGLPPEPKK